MPEAEELLKDLEQRGITKAKIGGFDVDGVLRGKYVSLDKLKRRSRAASASATSSSAGTSPTSSTTTPRSPGWHTGYPDAHAMLDLSTLRTIPWEPGTAAILADFRDEHGGAAPRLPALAPAHACSRARERMGYSAKFSLRVRVLPLQGDAASLHEKGFRELDAARRRACSATRGCARGRTRDADAAPSSTACARFDIEIEGLHTETGPGVYEVGHPLRRRAPRRRQGRALQDRDEADRVRARARRHLHGQVERRPARLERPPAPEPLDSGGKNVFSTTRARPTGSRRRCVTTSAVRSR